MFRMVALDMDGTLLNNQHQLTETTTTVLRRLSSKGIIICLATGRGLDSPFFKYLEVLDLPQREVPTVNYNGASASVFINGCTERVNVYSNPVSKENTQSLIEMANRLDLCLQ